MVRTVKNRTKQQSAPRVQKRPLRRDAGRPRGEPIAEAVLDQTIEELARVGVSQLNIDRIARSADVNKTSVYRRWPTREALIAAALERVLDDMTMQVPDTGSLRGDLLALGELVAAFLQQSAGRALAQAVFAESLAPSIAALARRQLEASAGEPTLAMVQRAVARGEWRPGVSPVTLLSMLVGAVLHRIMLEREKPSTVWLAGVVEILICGVQSRKPNKNRKPSA